MSTPLSTIGRPSRTTQGLLTAFTVVRLAFIPAVIATFMTAPAVTTTCLMAFMVADLYDGVLARRFDADGPRRRALDSIIDRLAIDACLIAACTAGALPLSLLIGFLVRDLYCSIVCEQMMRTRGVAIKTDLVYRGLSFAIAVWAIAAPFLAATTRTALAAGLLAAAVLVAVDLTRSVRLVLEAPADIVHRVIPATALRRGSVAEIAPRSEFAVSDVPPLVAHPLLHA